MRKLKTRLDRSKKEKLGKALVLDEVEAEDDGKDEVVRTKSYYLDPMSIDEAIARMEALGHNFFMYLDEDDNMISVAYKRNEGGYGVIQAENKMQ